MKLQFISIYPFIDYLPIFALFSMFQILETVPFDKVFIRVISIHLQDVYKHEGTSAEEYTQNVTRFLQTKSYKLVKQFENNYIYQLTGRSARIST